MTQRPSRPAGEADTIPSHAYEGQWRALLRGWDGVALLAIIIGLTLRVRELLSDRSLWLDESMLAVNILGRGFGELLRPLDYDQAAAPLFLWAVKLVSTLAGPGELALRLLPFVAGVVMLPATWRLGRAMFGKEVGALAAALVAISPGLIYYSAELKPYAVDALVSVCLLLLLRTWLAAPTRGRMFGLMGAGLLAIGVSLTSPFTLAVVGLYAMAWSAARGDRGGAAQAALVSVIWAGTFLVLYAVLIRHGDNRYLQEFWAGEFLGAIPSLRTAGWILVNALTYPLPLPQDTGGAVWLAVGFAGLIVVMMARHGWQYGVLLAGPGLMLGGASLMKLYPINERLILFMAPLTILIVSAGLLAFLERLGARPGLRGGIAIGMVTSGVVWSGTLGGLGPGMREGGAEVVREVVGRPDGEAAYILPGGGPKWVYYSTDWRRSDPTRIQWLAAQLSAGGPAFRNSNTVQGLTEADSLPLIAPGGALELLAYSAGGRTTDREYWGRAWSEAEAGRLRRAGVTRVWMYAGTYHDRDLPQLLPALASAGFTLELMRQTPGERVYRLTLPVDDATGAARRP